MLTIVAAALKVNGDIWALPAPKRHHDVIQFYCEKTGTRPIPQHEQGFLASDGTFRNREQSCFIASDAGQIDAPTMGQLFSEDLW